MYMYMYTYMYTYIIIVHVHILYIVFVLSILWTLTFSAEIDERGYFGFLYCITLIQEHVEEGYMCMRTVLKTM